MDDVDDVAESLTGDFEPFVMGRVVSGKVVYNDAN